MTSAHRARYGRSARGSPEPSIGGTPPTWLCDHQLYTPLVAYAYKFSAVYEIRRSHAGPQSPLVRPRASRPPLYSLLRSLVNRLIAHASLRRRFMTERRFRHTPNRGSVAPRRTSNRRFIRDCIHPSLLRRGATEPPDSHAPLYTFYMFYTANPLRTLRLCVSALKSPNPPLSPSPRSTRSTCSTRPIPFPTPNPSFPQSIPPNFIVFK